MEVQTKNTKYTLVDKGDGLFMIKGNPHYCPEFRPIVLDNAPVVGGYIEGRFQDEESGGLYTTKIQSVQS